MPSIIKSLATSLICSSVISAVRSLSSLAVIQSSLVGGLANLKGADPTRQTQALQRALPQRTEPRQLWRFTRLLGSNEGCSFESDSPAQNSRGDFNTVRFYV